MGMTIETKTALGGVLKSAREKANLTQEIAAEKAGIGLRSLQRAEKEGSINPASLTALCQLLGLNSGTIKAKAARVAERPPVTRLKMKELLRPKDVADLVAKGGSLPLAPEGTDAFNVRLAEIFLVQLDSTGSRKENEKIAQDALQLCRAYRYGLFGIHHHEEVVIAGKRRRRPCIYLIAGREDDRRVQLTFKGRVFDYVVDSRRQMWNRLTSTPPGLHEWIQNQLIKRCVGLADVAKLKVDVEKQIGHLLPDSMFEIDEE